MTSSSPDDTAPASSASLRWHSLPPEAVQDHLGVNPDGLSNREAADRLQRFGANRMPRRAPPSLTQLFLRQFKSPLVYLLLAAAAVSLALGEALDALFIFIVLLLNAGIGTTQEWQAQKKAAELDKMVPLRAVARRDGNWQELDASDLVPGDLVRLESGSRVSADLRLIENQELAIDESLLTGESLPVEKDSGAVLPADTNLAERLNLAYAGTTVLSGRASGLAVATGAATEIGRIAETLSGGDTKPPPLLGQLARMSRRISIATIGIILAIGTAAALQGTPLGEVFLIAIALAVAAIPEGLPVGITVALAIATSRMRDHAVIVRSLPAVEGLGACTLIASDKTGTLTCNELTVKALVLFDKGVANPPVEVTGEGYDITGEALCGGAPLAEKDRLRLHQIAESAALCNEASLKPTSQGLERLGDTVDVAFLVFAAKLGVDFGQLRDQHGLLASLPYEPERRFGAAFTASEETSQRPLVAHVKGAAEVILPMCSNVGSQAATGQMEALAKAGYRVLAVARGTVKDTAALEGLSLLGLVGLIDPIRPEVPAAIDRCGKAGIAVKMITGDHPLTALAIAQQLGLADDPAEVASQAEVAMLLSGTPELDHVLAEKRVFARVEPIQKLAIVQALQRQGHVVAVTGDGVNDAPALNAADIGVAMGRSGTDVARGAADLVITDDNFASIVAGIEEGRVAYDNVRKLINLLIATGLGEIVLFMIAILLGLPAPLGAVQLLWLNLVTNGIQDVALAFERGEPGIGDRRPRPPNQPLFDRRMIAQVALAGATMGGIGAAAYAWFLAQGMPLDAARNLLLLLMVLFENAHALNSRSERRSVFAVPLSANWFLIAAIIGAQGLHIAALFTPGLSTVLGTMPVGFLDWVMVVGLASLLVVVMEAFKRLTAKAFD